ncbi:MAG TPA: TRAM domain-containing protein [Acidimicrobiales bacterium]
MTGTAASLRITGVAVGGDGVAREPSGRVVFVEGALPGELVTARLVAERRGHARAVVTSVREPAGGRVAAPCPFVAAGCGGCGWQHVAVPIQRELKAAMVTEALARLGGAVDPVVVAAPPLPDAGYRTTLRGVADDGGRVALRRRHSHDLVAVPDCLVAHPLVAEVLAEGRFPPGAAVTVRAGAATGERMVVVDGPAGDGPDGSGGSGGSGEAGAPGEAGGDRDRIRVPDGVRVVGGAELAAGRRAWLHEAVAGVRLRVSARSFFQASRDAAEALVVAVGDAAGDVGGGTRLADLYGGVGLFAATVGRRARVEVVEASPSSAADARVNLRDLDARVVRSDVTRWRPRRMDVVVADPPRTGLGRRGVRVVSATGAPRVVLVSCDAGSLGRDVRLLREAGYRLVTATVVDAFPHTSHVEVVSRLDRTD